MRIIAGYAKGRRLNAPKGLSTRPTADRIKESIFNIIAPDINGAYFLDLFAGSGAIGLEALSRGARGCVFVDNSREAAEVIRANADNAKLSDKSELLVTDALAALNKLAERNKKFDLIFMDPPYDDAASQIESLTEAIGRLALLSAEGYVIGEHSAEIDISSFENIIPLKKKCYGKTTAVSIWRPDYEV